MYPILIILVGLGVQHLLNLRQSKEFKILMTLVFLEIYFLLSLNFLYIYFLRFPVYNSEAFDFGSRLLSKYISLAQKTGSETLIIADQNDPRMLSQHYLFYTDSYNDLEGSKLQQLFMEEEQKVVNKVYSYNKIHFTSKCPENTDFTAGFTIIIPRDSNRNLKFPNSSKLTIPQLSDGGTLFNIYGDQICGEYRLKTYPSNFLISDFKIEKLSDETFCEKFITKL